MTIVGPPTTKDHLLALPFAVDELLQYPVYRLNFPVMVDCNACVDQFRNQENYAKYAPQSYRMIV